MYDIPQRDGEELTNGRGMQPKWFLGFFSSDGIFGYVSNQ